MGFLNHSTNNIIIDAVLTEKGRELLSRNDRSFEISGFRLSDDEVDYSLITKYGHVVGKEKIEKNTPIFEALTGEDTSIKFPLLNLTNISNLLYMPKIVDINASANPFYSVSSSSNSNNSIRVVNVKTSITGVDRSFSLTESLIDDEFLILVNKNLLTLSNVPRPYKTRESIAAYKITGSSEDIEFTGQRFGEFSLTVSNDFTNDLYTLYGTSDNIIKTEIKVIGINSGATLIIPVEISLS